MVVILKQLAFCSCYVASILHAPPRAHNIIGIKSLVNSVIYLFQPVRCIESFPQRQVEESSWSVHSSQLDSVQVGLHGELSTVLLCCAYVYLCKFIYRDSGSQFDARGIEGDERCDKTS